ncbi:MAG: hypothetical protein J6K53_00670 [Roseburia sp.]|nr:hypothetical protein [Roseburia sp.]
MEQNKTQQTSNREVKSSAFTTYFSDPKNAAQLYSALEGVEVAPEDIHFTTLEGVLFVARKNDMAFTVKNRVLVISEHQSTVNNNMPLRDIIYYGRTMEKLIDPKALYRRKLISIPTPEFFVFYNGDEPFPSEQILKLSDAYLDKSKSPMLELTVKVININLPEGHALLARCRPLYEYSWFIQRIKEYMASGMNRDASITASIKDCEKEGIMVDFVRAHGTEAVNMLFTEFNMEDALEVRYEEGVEDGELLKLIQLVCRKLKKGKSAETIASELEEDTLLIDKICAAVEKSSPEATPEQIYKTFLSME